MLKEKNGPGNYGLLQGGAIFSNSDTYNYNFKIYMHKSP